MKHNFYIIPIILFFVFVSKTIIASSYKTSIYNAYISNNMQEWKAVIDSMENIKSDDIVFLAELVNYQYGYIGNSLAEKNKKMAKRYLTKAEKNLETLEEKGYSPATIHAYKSAFWGFKIGISPLRAPFYGGDCLEHAKWSVETDGSLALAHVQYGIAHSYMPAMFGGSDQIATEHYLIALKIMEEKPGQLVKNWNYLSLLTLIAQTYKEMKQSEKAKHYYQKALQVEPNLKIVNKKFDL